MARQPIALGFGESRSRPLMASRVVNLYPEAAPANSRAPGFSGDKGKVVHYGAPGIKTPIINTAGPVRAAKFVTTTANPDGYLYVLINSVLYRVDMDGVVTACTGAVIPGIGNAMMAANRTQLCLLANGTSFYVDSGAPTTVVEVTDADYLTASSLDYMDGYGIWTRADSDQWFLSSLNDFSDIDALDFATAESAPDGLVRVLVDHRIAWLFGETTVEPWVNTGASPFPFERVPGALMERGCAATMSPAKLAEGGVFFLGNDRVVYRIRGYQAVRISTPFIDEAIREGTVSDARGLAYSMGGHEFYAITFPTLGRSFVYDITQGIWHERQSDTELPYAAWNVTTTVDAWGKVWAGTTDGKFGELDLDTYTEAGSPIRRLIRSAPFFADGRRAFLDSVEVEMEVGVGLTTGQGSDPQIMMRFSRDGGATWSNERFKPIGLMGNRNQKIRFNKLGVFEQGMLEFSISDPVKVAIYGMAFRMRAAAS
jgi:hypothetical protein